MTGRPPLDHQIEQNPEIVCQMTKKVAPSTVQQKITYTLFSVLTS